MTHVDVPMGMHYGPGSDHDVALVGLENEATSDDAQHGASFYRDH